MARCRTQPLEAALRALVVRPGEHAPLVLAGLGSPAQAAAVPWATLGRGLARLDTVDVVCDLGRYLHGGGNRDLAEVCDQILVVTRSSLPASAPRCASSTSCMPAARLPHGPAGGGAGPALSGRRDRRSVSDTAGRRAARRSRTAAVWSDGAGAGRSLSRSPLQRAARHVAETLAGPEMSAATMPATPGQVAS